MDDEMLDEETAPSKARLAYNVILLFPPQNSLALPKHFTLQRPSVVTKLPKLKVLPHRHSEQYSTPKYANPVQFDAQSSRVMSGVAIYFALNLRIVVLSL